MEIYKLILAVGFIGLVLFLMFYAAYQAMKSGEEFNEPIGEIKNFFYFEETGVLEIFNQNDELFEFIGSGTVWNYHDRKKNIYTPVSQFVEGQLYELWKREIQTKNQTKK